MKEFDRRTFLKRTGQIGLGFLATPYLSSSMAETPPSITYSESIPLPDLGKEMLLGKEKEISLASHGITYAPDGHTTYVSFPDGKNRAFLSGHFHHVQGSIACTNIALDALYETGSPSQLQELTFTKGKQPDTLYRNGYSAITKVLQTNAANPNHLYALTHNEQWKTPQSGEGFTASVGLMESFDGGIQWNDHGPIIHGIAPTRPGGSVSGAGQPDAIIQTIDSNNFLSLYYVDWVANAAIYQTRIPMDSTGTLYPNIQEDNRLILSAPETIPNSGYAALPSLSYNTYLERLLMGFETDAGFCLTTSTDGQTWDTPQLIIPSIKTQAQREPGDPWRSYFTLVSPTESSDHTTNKSGYILYSKGQWQQTPHNLAMRPFRLR